MLQYFRERVPSLILLLAATIFMISAAAKFMPADNYVTIAYDISAEQATALYPDILITEAEYEMMQALREDPAIKAGMPEPLPAEGDVLENTYTAYFDPEDFEATVLDPLQLDSGWTVIHVHARGAWLIADLTNDSTQENLIYSLETNANILRKSYFKEPLLLENEDNKRFKQTIL